MLFIGPSCEALFIGGWEIKDTRRVMNQEHSNILYCLHNSAAGVWSKYKQQHGMTEVSAKEPLREGLMEAGVCWCMLWLLGSP